LACLLFIPAIPVILIAGLLVKLTSRGPMIYSQTRLGKHGRPFTIYKIRTMAHNCERLTGPQWAVPKDPRITPLGRFLRASHIDELPQLWNVLRGDMSLVGPRPERPEFASALDRTIPHYRERLLVRPGVTGFAQIQLPPDTDLASVRRKLVYDLYYVARFGFWLDVRIMLCTGLQMFCVPFGLLRVLLWLPAREVVEGHYHLTRGLRRVVDAQLVPEN
jgi:lipopolysaccharide/colanic/teichoic acid biosynthesis glycosyltransferase